VVLGFKGKYLLSMIKGLWKFDLLNVKVAARDGNARDVDKISIRDAIDITSMTSTFLFCVFTL